jgi:replicative DNA helicase
MEKGDLVLVAARPSMGKSGFAVCNITAHAAVRLKKRTAVFSVETKREKVISRLVGSESRVNMAAARKRGEFREDELSRISDAVALLNSSPLHVDHTPGLTLDKMRVKLRKLIRERGPVELVVVDYLGLMAHPKAKDRIAEVSEISRGLKQIAGEFDVVMVALSQLSRAVEARNDKRPMMSDLRESGTLEQDADLIMLLFRPEYYFGPEVTHGRGKDARKVDVRGKGEVILAKVREGETGIAHCLWEAEFTHFADPPQSRFF